MTRYRIHVRLPVRLTVGLTLPRFAFVVRKGRGGGSVRLTVRLTVGLTLPSFAKGGEGWGYRSPYRSKISRHARIWR